MTSWTQSRKTRGMCSGKVYYDLLEQRRKNDQKDVAIVRIEQLYPFPHKAVQEALQPYAHVHDFVWCRKSRSTRRMVLQSASFP